MGMRIYVISNVGADFGRGRRKWLRQMGVRTRFLRVRPAKTTRFEIRYDGEKRSLRVISKCKDITESGLPGNLQVRGLHIGPVLDEIPEIVAESLARRSSFTSLDPQGYLRRVGQGGVVMRKRWLDKNLLRRVDVLRGSSDELRMMMGGGCAKDVLRKLRRLGPSICILTKSSHGSDLLIDKGFFRIPVYEPQSVVDPTGAGDAFSGAFLVEYIRSRDPIWSACVAAAAASIKIETAGPCLIRDQSKLIERANVVLSGVQKR